MVLGGYDSGLNVDEETLVGVLPTFLLADGLKMCRLCFFQPVLDMYTVQFESRRSEVFERFQFLERHQLPVES